MWIPRASYDVQDGNQISHWILDSDVFNWNNKQKECFRLFRALPGGIGICEGVPGSGKNRTIADLVQLFCTLRRKKHSQSSTAVLVTVPTDCAGDPIFDAIQRSNKKAGKAINAVRVYKETNEVTSFLNKYRVEKPLEPPTAVYCTTRRKPILKKVEVFAAKDYAAATIIQTIATLKDGHAPRRYSLATHSLEAKVIRKAKQAVDDDIKDGSPRLLKPSVIRRVSAGLPESLTYLDQLPRDPGELFQIDCLPFIISYVKRMEGEDGCE